MKLYPTYGVYFHAISDFRHVVSSTDRANEFALENHLGELGQPQRYPNLRPGSPFFFFYPVRTSNGNKLVIAQGRIVPTLQKERKGLKVPFVQYYVFKLSEVAETSMDLTKLFTYDRMTYEEAFQRSQKTDFTLEPPSFDTSSLAFEPSDSNLNCQQLQGFFGLRGPKGKFYSENLEKGRQMLRCLMLNCSPVLRWSCSALLTPLDFDSKQNVTLVYGEQSSKNLERPTEPPRDISGLPEGEASMIMFLRFLESDKSILTRESDKLKLLDTIPLKDLDDALDKFVLNSAHKEHLLEELQSDRSKLLERIDRMKASDSTTIAQELLQVKSATAEFNDKLEDASFFVRFDREEQFTRPIAERLTKGLQNVSKKLLQDLVDESVKTGSNNDLAFVSARGVLDSSERDVTRFWEDREPGMSSPESVSNALKLISAHGSSFFIKKGEALVTDSIISSSNVQEAFRLSRAYFEKLYVSIVGEQDKDIQRTELLREGFGPTQHILDTLKIWLEKNRPLMNPDTRKIVLGDLRFIAERIERLETIRRTLRSPGDAPSYKDIQKKVVEIAQTAKKSEKKSLDEMYESESARIEVEYKNLF